MENLVFNNFKNKVFWILGIFINLLISFNINGYATDVPTNQAAVLQFTKDDKNIIVVASCHTVSLANSLSKELYSELVNKSTKLFVEHYLGNMALKFLEKGYIVKLERGNNLENKKIKNLDLIFQMLDNKEYHLIKGFDFDKEGEAQYLEKFNFRDILKWEPWIAYMLISNEITLRIMREYGEGMEFELIKMFTEASKDIEFLETPKEIFNIYKQYGGSEFKDSSFKESFLSLTSPDEFNIKKSGFTKFDQRCTLSKINIDTTQHPKSVNIRNKLWVNKILKEVLPKMEANESVLMVVGYGHLSGSEGLIKLLKNANFEVTELTQ